jgi:hypothetical protein
MPSPSMQSGRRAAVWSLVTSLVGVQPSFQDFDGILKMVAAADRGESLSAADSAGAAKGLERGEGKLRLGKRQVGLGAETCVPARRRFLEPPRLLVKRQQQQRQGVGEWDRWKLRRQCPGEQKFRPSRARLNWL